MCQLSLRSVKNANSTIRVIDDLIIKQCAYYMFEILVLILHIYKIAISMLKEEFIA